MPHGVTIRSLPAAFETMKGMHAQGLGWGEDFRPVARRLVESYGAKFIGILQPVAYYSDTKLDHIRLNAAQKKQFEVVYPLIRQKMAGRQGLYDLTGALDRQEYVYIDFCHLSPNGNRYVAQKLVEVLARLD